MKIVSARFPPRKRARATASPSVFPSRSLAVPLGVGALVAVVDFLTKGVVQYVPEGLSVAPGVLIAPTNNPRGPFSALPLSLTLLVSVGVLAFFFLAARSAATRGERIAFGSILGGGSANLIERALTGRTTDVLVVGTSAWNVADAGIVAGIVIIIVLWLRRGRTVATPR